MGDLWFTLRLVLAISSGVILVALWVSLIMVAIRGIFELLAYFFKWLARVLGG